MNPVLLTTTIALAGAVAGFLVAWGAMRSTIARLSKDFDELRADVKQLNLVVVRLGSHLALHADREEMDLALLLGHHPTGGVDP